MSAASRSRPWRVLVCVIVGLVLAGCSGASTPAGTPRPSNVGITPRPEASPTPEPSRWSSGWLEGGLDVNFDVQRDLQGSLFDTCFHGTPVPGAAPYAGKVHPLVVMDMDNGWLAYDVDINQGFRETGWAWPSPIQLVVCARHEQDARKVGSCGLYKTEDGEVGEVVRYQDRLSIRVIVATTGKSLQTKILSGPVPTCPGTKSWTSGSWGWTLKDKVTAQQIDEYARTVSKQPVK
jgi:hypothetical protein